MPADAGRGKVIAQTWFRTTNPNCGGYRGDVYDLHMFDARTNQVHGWKIATTPADPSLGLMQGLREASRPSDAWDDCRHQCGARTKAREGPVGDHGRFRAADCSSDSATPDAGITRPKRNAIVTATVAAVTANISAEAATKPASNSRRIFLRQITPDFIFTDCRSASRPFRMSNGDEGQPGMCRSTRITCETPPTIE
jgi:hypothetical protein